MSARKYDIAIIGGGIVGLSCALEAQVRGLTVAVVDEGNRTARASYGNAGVISRGSILPIGSPETWRKLPRYLLGRDAGMRVRHLDLPQHLPWIGRFLAACNKASWRAAAEALNPFVGGALDAHLRLARLVDSLHLIRRNGWLKLYRSPNAFTTTTLEREILATAGVRTQVLAGDAIQALEPALERQFSHALFFPDTASVDDPAALVDCYRAHVIANSGSIVTGRAVEIACDGNGVVVQLSSGQPPVRAGFAVIAAGIGSHLLARTLGYRIPLAAERGYHQDFDELGLKLSRPVFDVGGGYVISPMNRAVRVLTGTELAAAHSSANYSQIKRAVVQARHTIALGSPVGSPWLGSRPSTPDGLPVIGWAPRHRRIAFAFGHGHIGLSTGPITGGIVADLITGRPPAIEQTAFRPERWTI